MISGRFRIANIGLENAQMIVEGFAAITLVPFLHHAQADFVDDRLIGCAIATALPHVQYLGNVPRYYGANATRPF